MYYNYKDSAILIFLKISYIDILVFVLSTYILFSFSYSIEHLIAFIIVILMTNLFNFMIVVVESPYYSYNIIKFLYKIFIFTIFMALIGITNYYINYLNHREIKDIVLDINFTNNFIFYKNNFNKISIVSKNEKTGKDVIEADIFPILSQQRNLISKHRNELKNIKIYNVYRYSLYNSHTLINLRIKDKNITK